MNQDVIFFRQLMFNETYNEIIEEEVKYWKNMDDVPEYIKKFILFTLDLRVIYDYSTEKYYCSKCIQELDNNNFCNNCSKKYIIYSNESKYTIKVNINYIRSFHEKSNYYVFDVVDGYILLYVFSVNIHYDSRVLLVPYQICNVEIEKIYRVTSNGITNIITKDFLSFDEYEKNITCDCDFFNYDLFELFEVPDVSTNFLYTANLLELKNTSLYRYTSIWKLNEYFTNRNFTLSSLTFYPIHFKQFEYLVKMKLYRLASDCPYIVEFKHNFKDSFGVDKKYYPFMLDINISGSELEALRIYPTTDIELINFVLNSPNMIKELSTYIKIDKLKNYFEKQNLNYQNIHEYYDYIKCCESMGLDLKDKNILYPKSFIEEHDKLSVEMTIIQNPEIDKKIHLLSDILSLNIYEDEQFIIFPANSVVNLIDESTQMSNCVRNYCNRISNNECQIYFMRYKNSVNKSLVTIEVIDGRIVQARTKFNALPTKEMNEVLKKWEKQLIPIINTN